LLAPLYGWLTEGFDTLSESSPNATPEDYEVEAPRRVK
jgi:hypothetical protein